MIDLDIIKGKITNIKKNNIGLVFIIETKKDLKEVNIPIYSRVYNFLEIEYGNIENTIYKTIYLIYESNRLLALRSERGNIKVLPYDITITDESILYDSNITYLKEKYNIDEYYLYNKIKEEYLGKKLKFMWNLGE